MTVRRLTDITNASENVLDCRDLGHAWHKTNDTNVTRGPRGKYIEFTRVDECERCGTTRRRVYEVPSFRIKSSSMTYADQYLAPKGKRYARADARREAFRRFTEQSDV